MNQCQQCIHKTIGYWKSDQKTASRTWSCMLLWRRVCDWVLMHSFFSWHRSQLVLAVVVLDPNKCNGHVHPHFDFNLFDCSLGLNHWSSRAAHIPVLALRWSSDTAYGRHRLPSSNTLLRRATALHWGRGQGQIACCWGACGTLDVLYESGSKFVGLLQSVSGKP